ncbi:hypothetical protein [Aeromonas sp. s5]|uniref:hypothetical protein n=1 Tax=Aeromonas TaxID=642 RepID=UPI0034A136C5
MYHGLKGVILKITSAVIIVAAAGLYFISWAQPSKNDNGTMIAMSTFFNRPSVFFMYAGKDNHPESEYSYRWLRNGAEIQNSKFSMLNIAIDELLGVVSEELKGCVTISHRHRYSEPEYCVVYQPVTLLENSFPPEATLFTYTYPKHTLNAKYYYHSSTSTPEGDSKFAWVMRKRNGFIGLIKTCALNEQCSLNITDDMMRESIGVFVQPSDQQGTIGRGDIKWFFINGNKRALSV